MATQRCPYCAAPNDERQRYCRECGEALDQPSTDAEVAATRPFTPADTLTAGEGQRTEVFRPVAEPPSWDAASWQPRPSPAEPRASTAPLPDLVAAPRPSGHGVLLGCIAFLLIGLVAAAVLWLTFVGPDVPMLLGAPVR